jgi:predicted nucleic acid-binding protein
MTKKIKLYFDTSVISSLFDTRNPERRDLTESFFNKIDDYEVFISEVTVMEIDRTQDLELRDKMKEMVLTFSILYSSNDVEFLAREYISYGAVPDGYPEDAYHIAIAVINSIDYILSWNFRHIVRMKTRDIVRMVNTLNGFRQIEIITPAELL